MRIAALRACEIDAVSSAIVFRWVVAALLPGAVAMTWFFGSGMLLNMLSACLAAVAAEVVCLLLRRAGWRQVLDGSALVTALLIALATPPSQPLVVALAAVAAIALGKHAFGGLGQNPFNPAMVGYALILVSYPSAFATWPQAIDGVSAATALDVLKYNSGTTIAELTADPAFGRWGGNGWETVNAAFAIGGIVLMARRLLAWRVVVAYLGCFAVLAFAFYDGGSSASKGGLLFHWLSGGTMLTAFFVVTDPVTHPTGHTAQVLFAIIAAATAFTIRAFGAYPDGLAFGVLLANACAPYLQRRFP